MTATIEERVATLESVASSLSGDISRLVGTTDKLDAKIDAKFDKLANRLPTWATVMFSLLTMAIGALAATVASMS